jgi:hypothetical protein
MNRHFPILVLASALLASCGGRQDAPANQAQADPAAANQTSESEGALGISERELRDADVVDAAGNDLGDIDGVRRDATGRIAELFVEIEDTDPDRHVYIPLTGAEAFRDGDGWDVRIVLTRDQLMALPEAQP